MPNSNTDIVRQRLEASRKNLLDTSLRNRLINYRKSRTAGLEITGEDPAEVFRILVIEGKPMTFTGKPDKANAQQPEPPSILNTEPEAASNQLQSQDSQVATDEATVDQFDTKLNTNETISALENRLLKTWHDAQTSLEEQGLNVLFLALGMLEWYEAETSQEVRKAPLILVPVLIERTRGSHFRIRYEGAEISGNLSLAAKLQQEFRITLPEMAEAESLDVRAYFSEVQQAIARQKRWRADEQAIALGFFSYAKYLMYKDLEGALWDEQSKPWTHDILGALLDCGFDERETGISEEDNLDQHRRVQDANEVCDADSSQALAILEAKSGRSMIIEGPPGTGKSQTITNLIAEAVGEGKKVLFVAEKRAALDVVWRRLEESDLHEACLELHSNKANKRGFYSRLEETVKLGRPRVEQMRAQLEKLSLLRDSLNQYCEAVNCVLPRRHIAPIAAMGGLLALGEAADDFRAPDFSVMLDWSQQDFEQRIDLVKRIESKVAEIGPPSEHLFFGAGLRLFLPDDRNRIVAQIKAAIETTKSAQESARNLAGRLEIAQPETASEAHAICRAASHIAAAPPVAGVAISDENWSKNSQTLRDTINAGKRFAVIRNDYGKQIKPQSWAVAIEEDRKNIARYGEKWWRFLSGRYRASIRKLGSLCAIELPKPYAERLALADRVIESQAIRKQIAQVAPLCQSLFGAQWQGEQSDWQALHAILEWTLDLHAKISAGQMRPEILRFLEAGHDGRGLAEETARVNEALFVRESKIAELLASLQAEGELKSLASNSFSDQLSRLNRWLENIASAQEIVSFNLLRDAAAQQGLEAAVEMARSWNAAGTRLVESFKRAWYNGVLREAFQTRPALAMFDRSSHETAINSFCQLDLSMLSYNRAKIALKHWAGAAPARESALGSLGLLQREFAKQTRHKPIRKIMSEAGEAIQTIKPVFMMSPPSVATYLPPDGPRFDLVIFDEASQVKPEDAFGAIIRARQVIVVGDSKQMPPTSFFDKLTQTENDNDEDDELEINITRDMESILALMSSKTPARSPRRRDLRWHYRSQHDSLITVSNTLFYNQRLYVFPSADRNRRDIGLIFHHLPNTVYGRGGSRKNPDEARTVAQAALDHAKDNPQLSLVIVAFSGAQQEAIEDELDRLCDSDPALKARYEEFLRSHGISRLVKNLETVQGDEADVVFISIGYGRDANGYVSMNFGPLNKDGGERRLNVLITRARLRCEVFANLRSSDIRIAETRAPGVQALRAFLHFAETGEMDLPTPTGREPDSDFEVAVMEAIRAHGYKAVGQVGSAGFFVDIGICDPDNTERFVLGIECDGAQYHSARSARDRDRLRQEVLEQRGWRIHRIWSTDWWRNSEQELKRALTAIEQAIAVKASPVAPSALPDQAQEVKREQSGGARPVEFQNAYMIAKPNVTLAGTPLRDASPQQMAEWVRQVVDVESPVHFEEVVRRIREAANLERAGNAIRECVQRGIQYAASRDKIIVDDDFLWRAPKHETEIRNRSSAPNSLKKLDSIHAEEIKAALRRIIGQSFGIAREEAISASFRLLGFERTTEAICERADQLISELVANGALIEQGKRLKIAGDLK